jgi:hypothetical protein
MGIATFPSVSSPIKSVQRGTAASAGTVTITAVDISKSFVNSFSTSSTGTVAASGNINAANGSTSAPSGTLASGSGSVTMGLSNATGTLGGSTRYAGYTPSMNLAARNISMNAANIALNAQSISGGSTNLVSAVYGAYLTNSTTLTVTGPCRYEVVEYY